MRCYSLKNPLAVGLQQCGTWRAGYGEYPRWVLLWHPMYSRQSRLDRRDGGTPAQVQIWGYMSPLQGRTASTYQLLQWRRRDVLVLLRMQSEYPSRGYSQRMSVVRWETNPNGWSDLPNHDCLRDIGVPQNTHHVSNHVEQCARGLDIPWSCWSTKAANTGDNYTVIILQTAIRKWRIARAEDISHLELLNLIFPTGPETRPAMNEQERTIGVRVTDINIFCRARIEIKDRKQRLGEHTEVQINSLVVFCTIDTRTGRHLQMKSIWVERGVGVSCCRGCQSQYGQQTACKQE